VKKLFFFLAGGATVIIGRRYSREIGRALVKGALQANQAFKQLAEEAAGEAAIAATSQAAAGPSARARAPRRIDGVRQPLGRALTADASLAAPEAASPASAPAAVAASAPPAAGRPAASQLP
jgi:hypothetical protein